MNIISLIFAVSLTALASVLPFTKAHAALPTGTLEYLQRTGTAAATDDIPIWMRFTLAPSSSPLTFSSNPVSGFNPADLPVNGQRYDALTNTFVDVPFASIQSVVLQSWYSCTTTFFSGCDTGGEYGFIWGGDEPGFPNPTNRDSYSMNPGESVDYLLGTLRPRTGAAAPGTYEFPMAGLQLNFRGLDVNGDQLYGYHGLDSTCPAATDCVFTRTVLAVPEPAALPVLGLGLCLLSSRKKLKVLTQRAAAAA